MPNIDPTETPANTDAELVTADELLGDTPAVTDQGAPTPAATPKPASATAPTAPPPTPENDPFRGQKDSRGVEWNPVKFRLKDGKPQLDSKGRFVPAGAGRKAEADTAAGGDPTGVNSRRPSSSLPPDEGPPGSEAIPEITAEIGVDVAIGLIQTCLIMIGEEEGELTEVEVKMLRGPMLRVLAKYNLSSKMTPELECAAVVAALIMRRLKKPKTQNWFLAKLAWVRGWWNARKLKRVVPDVVPATS